MLLGERLASYETAHPLVLGIPRGGVVMADIVGTRLHADVDVMLVRKLRAPFQPELALGAIDEGGQVHLTEFAGEMGLGPDDLAAERREQMATLRARRQLYTGDRTPHSLAGRTVILVDDGLATGSTALAAVRAARGQQASRVVVAAAVAPPATVQALGTEADDVVVLFTPEYFAAVGAFFDDFSEVSDEDVVRILRRHATSART